MTKAQPLAVALSERPVDDAAEAGGLAGFFAARLGEIARGGAGLAAVAVPAPAGSLDALLQAGLPLVTDGAALLWQPGSGPGAVGLGAAATVTARGPERISATAAAAGRVLSGIRTSSLGAGAPAPRCYGGFAFAAGAADAAPWEGFGDARFVLPRWCYHRDGDRAWLTLTVDAAAARDGERWLAELARLLDAAGQPPPGDTAASALPAVVATSPVDAATWRRQIASIHDAIAGGRAEKIVAARKTLVELAGPAEAAAVLARLGQRHPDCVRFGLRAGDAWFVGASPEWLVRLSGHEVATGALAGSIARSDGTDVSAAAALLLDSGKDRGEHDLVVQAIAEALAPRCSALTVSPQPEVVALRHVLHMYTPIRGTLRRPTHVLDLVEALHPTPAVGGVPTAAALDWIATGGESPRGWYAAPVGWFDAEGQGELAVAIRSGLLRGAEAHVWAGAGIVRGSDAGAELAETQLKQRALLGALGAMP